MIELTDKQKLIYTGKHCPYCDIATKLVSSTVVYNKDYGKIYYCEKCKSYVGCHGKGDMAKGRVANKELRAWKMQAHLYFDKIWKLNHLKRNEAYKWLSEKLNISPLHTHIGMFNIDTCKDVVYYSKQLLNDFRRLDMDYNQEPKTEHHEKRT